MTVPLLTCCFVLSWVDFPSCDSVILTRIHLSLPLTKRVHHNGCQGDMEAQFEEFTHNLAISPAGVFSSETEN